MTNKIIKACAMLLVIAMAVTQTGMVGWTDGVGQPEVQLPVMESVDPKPTVPIQEQQDSHLKQLLQQLDVSKPGFEQRFLKFSPANQIIVLNFSGNGNGALTIDQKAAAMYSLLTSNALQAGQVFNALVPICKGGLLSQINTSKVALLAPLINASFQANLNGKPLLFQCVQTKDGVSLCGKKSDGTFSDQPSLKVVFDATHGALRLISLDTQPRFLGELLFDSANSTFYIQDEKIRKTIATNENGILSVVTPLEPSIATPDSVDSVTVPVVPPVSQQEELLDSIPTQGELLQARANAGLAIVNKLFRVSDPSRVTAQPPTTTGNTVSTVYTVTTGTATDTVTISYSTDQSNTAGTIKIENKKDQINTETEQQISDIANPNWQTINGQEGLQTGVFIPVRNLPDTFGKSVGRVLCVVLAPIDLITNVVGSIFYTPMKTRLVEWAWGNADTVFNPRRDQQALIAYVGGLVLLPLVPPVFVLTVLRDLGAWLIYGKDAHSLTSYLWDKILGKSTSYENSKPLFGGTTDNPIGKAANFIWKGLTYLFYPAILVIDFSVCVATGTALQPDLGTRIYPEFSPEHGYVSWLVQKEILTKGETTEEEQIAAIQKSEKLFQGISVRIDRSLGTILARTVVGIVFHPGDIVEGKPVTEQNILPGAEAIQAFMNILVDKMYAARSGEAVKKQAAESLTNIMQSSDYMGYGVKTLTNYMNTQEKTPASRCEAMSKLYEFLSRSDVNSTNLAWKLNFIKDLQAFMEDPRENVDIRVAAMKFLADLYKKDDATKLATHINAIKGIITAQYKIQGQEALCIGAMYVLLRIAADNAAHKSAITAMISTWATDPQVLDAVKVAGTIALIMLNPDEPTLEAKVKALPTTGVSPAVAAMAVKALQYWVTVSASADDSQTPTKPPLVNPQSPLGKAITKKIEEYTPIAETMVAPAPNAEVSQPPVPSAPAMQQVELPKPPQVESPKPPVLPPQTAAQLTQAELQQAVDADKFSDKIPLVPPQRKQDIIATVLAMEPAKVQEAVKTLNPPPAATIMALAHKAVGQLTSADILTLKTTLARARLTSLQADEANKVTPPTPQPAPVAAPANKAEIQAALTNDPEIRKITDMDQKKTEIIAQVAELPYSQLPSTIDPLCSKLKRKSAEVFPLEQRDSEDPSVQMQVRKTCVLLMCEAYKKDQADAAAEAKKKQDFTNTATSGLTLTLSQAEQTEIINKVYAMEQAQVTAAFSILGISAPAGDLAVQKAALVKEELKAAQFAKAAVENLTFPLLDQKDIKSIITSVRKMSETDVNAGLDTLKREKTGDLEAKKIRLAQEKLQAAQNAAQVKVNEIVDDTVNKPLVDQLNKLMEDQGKASNVLVERVRRLDIETSVKATKAVTEIRTECGVSGEIPRDVATTIAVTTLTDAQQTTVRRYVLTLLLNKAIKDQEATNTATTLLTMTKVVTSSPVGDINLTGIELLTQDAQIALARQYSGATIVTQIALPAGETIPSELTAVINKITAPTPTANEAEKTLVRQYGLRRALQAAIQVKVTAIETKLNEVRLVAGNAALPTLRDAAKTLNVNLTEIAVGVATKKPEEVCARVNALYQQQPGIAKDAVHSVVAAYNTAPADQKAVKLDIVRQALQVLELRAEIAKKEKTQSASYQELSEANRGFFGFDETQGDAYSAFIAQIAQPVHYMTVQQLKAALPAGTNISVNSTIIAVSAIADTIALDSAQAGVLRSEVMKAKLVAFKKQIDELVPSIATEANKTALFGKKEQDTLYFHAVARDIVLSTRGRTDAEAIQSLKRKCAELRTSESTFVDANKATLPVLQGGATLLQYQQQVIQLEVAKTIRERQEVIRQITQSRDLLSKAIAAVYEPSVDGALQPGSLTLMGPQLATLPDVYIIQIGRFLTEEPDAGTDSSFEKISLCYSFVDKKATLVFVDQQADDYTGKTGVQTMSTRDVAIDLAQIDATKPYEIRFADSTKTKTITLKLPKVLRNSDNSDYGNYIGITTADGSFTASPAVDEASKSPVRTAVANMVLAWQEKLTNNYGIDRALPCPAVTGRTYVGRFVTEPAGTTAGSVIEVWFQEHPQSNQIDLWVRYLEIKENPIIATSTKDNTKSVVLILDEGQTNTWVYENVDLSTITLESSTDASYPLILKGLPGSKSLKFPKYETWTITTNSPVEQ